MELIIVVGLTYFLLQGKRRHVISRSWLGLLHIRFDGGCSYPGMMELLQDVYKRTGYLIAVGEALSGPDWINRIVAAGHCLSDQERTSILTLMWAVPKTSKRLPLLRAVCCGLMKS